MDNQQIQFSSFESALDQSISDAWGSQELDAHLNKLEEEAKLLAEEAKKVGSYSQTKHADGNAEIGDFIGTYVFPEKAKSILILWRDILFQQQKAEILKLEEKSTPKDLKELNVLSKDTLVNAADSIRNLYSKEVENIRGQRGGQLKAIEKWKIQHSPWETYEKQFDLFPEQCTMLREKHQELKEVTKTFEEIKSQILEIASSCEKDLEKYNQLAESSIPTIEENSNSEGELKPAKIISALESTINNLEIQDYPELINSSINELIDKLPEWTKIPVATEGGVLKYKEINFKRSVKQWLDSEILPLMNEVCELSENTGNNFKMSLMNICNKAKILSAEIKEGKTPEVGKSGLAQPIINFQKKVADTDKELKSFRKTISQRLKSEFNVSSVYDLTEMFLPVSIQSTIRQYNRIGQNEFLNRTRTWWKKGTQKIKGLIRQVEKEDQLSTSEKVVRYVKSKMNVEDNFYSNIFMTSGYIGDSFLVGREDELERMKDLVENWKSGFRGSAAIIGDRFSGKTLFGELVINRFFQANHVRLQPDAKVKFAGRHIDTTRDLEAALAFVKKHAGRNQVLIWIDDLEHWWDNDIPLNKNVRSLKKYINDTSSNIFVVVSMSTWLKKHLSKFHNFEAIFQSEINMNKTSASEVSEAILIRHGATHKTLINKSTNEDATTAELRTLIQRVYNSSNGIMGEALARWSNSIKKSGEDQVVYESESAYSLPDFFTPETGILLTTILLAKRINEYSLRKKFGPAFNEKYKSMLQRLLSMGVLKREIDGALIINPVVVNDVAYQLVKKKYL